MFDLQGNLARKYFLDYGVDIHDAANTIIATEVKSNDSIIKLKI